MAVKVRRVITVFRIGDDRRIAQFDVTNVPFDTVAKIVRPDAFDPLLYNCYKLRSDQLAALQPYVETRLALDGLDYYLEAEAA